MSLQQRGFSRQRRENQEEGRTQIEKDKQTAQAKDTVTNERKYSNNLHSRFGTAFLPYASELESIGEKRVTKKRRARNKRRPPREITNIPTYRERDKKKGQEYDEKIKSNTKN
jgi:hypothetical protein